MANFDLGRAQGELSLKYNPQGGAAAKADIDRIEGSAKKGAGPALDQLGRNAALAGAGIAAGLALAVNAAANFEQKLSGIEAVSGATASQMDQVRKKALQLGADTKFSAAEAATAIEELAKAGIPLPDILNGAADATVALAAAGEIELPRAAEIAANAMNTFGLKAEDLPRVADLVAGAANASAISVEEFAQSMQQSGAAANLAGVGFDDLATSIALMGNAGIKGSDAGTSLKTFLLNLQPSTKKQTELFKKLGLITKEGGNQFFDAAGKAKSMAEIAGVLQGSLKGMTQQQKLATLETLFGSDAIRAAAVISNNGAKGFENMATAMTKVKAADVAATRMNNLKGQIETMKGSLETAAIVIGSVMIPALTAMVKSITGIVNSFAQLSPNIQKNIVGIAGAAAAFLLIVGTALKVISVVRNLAIAFQLLWASALGPVAIIIALVLGLAAAVFVLYNKFAPVRAVVDAVGRALATAFNAALPVLQRLGQVFMTVVLPALIAVGRFLQVTFGPVFAQVISIVSGFVTGIIGYFRSIMPQLTTIFNAIVAIVRWAFNLLSPIVVPILRFLLNFVISTLQLLATGIRILLAGIANIFRGVFNIIGGIIKVFLSLLTGNWRGALQGLVQIAKGIWQIIKGVFQAALGIAIIGICVSSLKVIGSVFRAGFNAVRSVVTGAINAVRSVISGGMAAARAVVQGVVAAIRAYFNALNAIVGIVQGIFGRVVGAIGSVLGRAVSVVSGIGGRIVGAVTGIGGRLFAAGQQIISQLVSGITSRIEGAVSAVRNAVGRIASLIPHSPVKEGPLKVLNRGRAGRQIIQMLIDGINARRSDLAAAARSVTFPVAERVSTIPAALAASASRSTRVGTTEPVAGRVYAPNVTVNNPPPVSGERQVLDALSKLETLYSPFQGVYVG